MLLTIRINLLGRGKAAKSKRSGPQLPDVPNLGILIFLLMLVVEGAVFYLWQMRASDSARAAENQVRQKEKELKELETNKQAIAQTKEQVDKLKKNKTLFDEMFAEKVGPVNTLTYLSFITQVRDEATTPSEELKAMEAAGWRVAWNAKRAWFTSFREIQGEVTLQGEAMAHEDVAELQRRLESSPYFRSPKLVFQDVKREERLGVPYVEFSIRAWLVYLIDPLPNPAAEAAAAAAAGEADGGASADGADAGGDGGETGGSDVAVIGAKLPQIALPTDASATSGGSDDAHAGAADADAHAGKDADAKAEPDAPPAPDVAAEPRPDPKPEPAKAKEDPLPPAKAPLPPAAAPATPPPAAESAAPPPANEP